MNLFAGFCIQLYNSYLAANSPKIVAQLDAIESPDDTIPTNRETALIKSSSKKDTTIGTATASSQSSTQSAQSIILKSVNLMFFTEQAKLWNPVNMTDLMYILFYIFCVTLIF